MAAAIRRRPKHLDLLKIRLPLPGVVSIIHRVTGVVLVLFLIPLMLWALQASLRSPDAFAAVRSGLGNPLMKLVMLGFVFAYVFHFCAGIRFLLLDIQQGIKLESARTTSKIVIIVSIVLTLLVGFRIW